MTLPWLSANTWISMWRGAATYFSSRTRLEPHAAHAIERFAKSAATVGHEQRQTQRARPQLPFRDHVIAVGLREQRHAQGGIAMLERKHDAFALLRGDETKRDAQEGVKRKFDRHGNAAHRTAEHDALAVELDPSHPLVGPGIGRRETDRQCERVEPQSAARPGRHGPAELPLTPQNRLPVPSLRPGFVWEHAAAASESA